ncbi:MAG: hypothetical protein O3A81_01120, partial [bacterium]|nr:hypothetical protein [bacterium]
SFALCIIASAHDCVRSPRVSIVQLMATGMPFSVLKSGRPVIPISVSALSVTYTPQYLAIEIR